MKYLHEWLRETYRIEERSKQHRAIRAFDKESGVELARWEEGGRVPLFMWERYLEENPETLEIIKTQKEHSLKHHPLRVSLR